MIRECDALQASQVEYLSELDWIPHSIAQAINCNCDAHDTVQAIMDASSDRSKLLRETMKSLAALALWLLTQDSSDLTLAMERAQSVIESGKVEQVLQELIGSSQQAACEVRKAGDSILDHIERQRVADVAAAKSRRTLGSLEVG